MNERNDYRFDQKEFIAHLWRVRNDWGGIASQEWIADQTGISQTTISRIFNANENGYKIKVHQFIELLNLLSPETGIDHFIKKSQ